MQFNSYIFILLFLPVFLVSYFLINRIHNKGNQVLIIIAGIVFYYYAGLTSFIMLLISAIANLTLSFIISFKAKDHKPKFILIITLTINIGLLLFYKLAGFLSISNSSFVFKNVVMPLGISFFTFQQIMYVVSVYNNNIDKVSIIDYFSYIMFFPKLIMGPITDPIDLISQMKNQELKHVNWDNLASGIKLFSFGLFKKLVLADTFTKGVEWGFSNLKIATSADIFLTMLFYTFEIYFDFSGYSDMAVGVSKMINIELPINFDSPYKATSIRDFWKRWHISLTKFFTKYIYFPLGGNRKGHIRTYVNIMIVFLISGLWHGANWTFILWGGIHGLLQVLERLFLNIFNKLSEVVRWIYTFGAVNVLWLLFRADSIVQWKSMLSKMLTFQDTSISDGMLKSFVLPETSFLFNITHLTNLNGHIRGFSLLLFVIAGFVICLIPNNNYNTKERKNVINMVFAAAAFVWAFICLSSESVFVYNNF